MKTFFELVMPGDCEGKSLRSVGYFTDEAVARNIGKAGHGNMLMAPNSGEVRELRVYETAEDFYEDRPDADPYRYPEQIDLDKISRERALKKLSPDERRALGLPR